MLFGMIPHLPTFDYDNRRLSIKEILDCRRVLKAIKRIRDICLAPASSPSASSAPGHEHLNGARTQSAAFPCMKAREALVDCGRRRVLSRGSRGSCCGDAASLRCRPT